MKKKRRGSAPLRFPSVPLTDLPDGHSRHRKIVTEILQDLRELDEYASVKIDLIKVREKKAELRAALHRAAKKWNMKLSTASDERYLYVFHRSPNVRFRR